MIGISCRVLWFDPFFDFENRLVTPHSTLNSQPSTINIAYDGDGNRVSKTISTATNSITTYYVVDDLNPSGYAQVLEEHVSLNHQKRGQTITIQQSLVESVKKCKVMV